MGTVRSMPAAHASDMSCQTPKANGNVPGWRTAASLLCQESRIISLHGQALLSRLMALEDSVSCVSPGGV